MHRVLVHRLMFAVLALLLLVDVTLSQDLVCTSSNNDIQVNGSNPSSISSPNFPAEYPDNLQCTWRITTAVQSRVKVTIKGVDFGNNDFIVFRDGNMEDSPEIAKYAKCGSGELQLYSTGRHMLVNFVSDAGSPGKGFQLDYQAVPSDKVICQPKPADSCPIYRDADGKSGVIRNPASPQGLAKSVFCSVTLEVPAGNRMLLTYYWFGLAGKTGSRSSCRDDMVEVRAVGSSSDKYCGCDLPPKKIYDSEKVYFQLTTWTAANRPGLMASYRALGPHECIEGAAACAPRAGPIGSNKDGDYCYDTMLEEEGGEVVLNNTSKLQIECDEYITVTVKRSDYPGFAPYTATLDDPDCKATFVNETVVTFKFGPEYCKTIAEDDGEKIHYKNAIHAKVEMHSDDSAITRKHMTVLPFQCSYEKKATISKVSYSPRVSKVITSAADFGNFTYFMDMYTTEDYDDKVDEFPVEVGLGQRMFLEIRVESGDKDLLVFPEMCKATLSSKYSDKPDHEFIEDSCSRDNTLEYDYSMSAVQRFSLAAFRFKDGYDDVFLHCKMTVCRKQDSESRCVKGCEASGDGIGNGIGDGGRKRRSVPEDYSVNLYVGPVGIQETQEADPGPAQTEQTVEGSSSTMVVIVAVVGILAVVAVGLIVAMVIIFKRRRPFSHTSILVVPEDEDH